MSMTCRSPRKRPITAPSSADERKPRSDIPAGSATGSRAGLRFVLVLVFLDVLGIGLALPILPVLVGEFTGSREMQSYWYGILAISFGLMQFLCAPVFGALSDRFGRRPLLLVSVTGLGLSFLALALAPNLWVMLAARLWGGITAASLPVAFAYASDVSTREARARSFGVVGAVFGMGYVFGPVIGGVLGELDLRLPFFVAAALSLLNLCYGYFVLPESLLPANRSKFALAKANPFAALVTLTRRREIGSLVCVIALMVFAQVLLQLTWVLYTHFRFGWGTRDNGIALFCVGIVHAVVQGLLLPRLLARFGDIRLALVGLAVGVFAYACWGFADQGWMMYAIIFLSFLMFAAGPALQGVVSRSVEPTHQGVTMGALTSINSLMFVITPLIAAPLLASVSSLSPDDWRFGAAFFVCAVAQLLALQICSAS